jgi:hypothetical protein
MARPRELCRPAEAGITFNQFEKAQEALAEALTMAEGDDARYCEADSELLPKVVDLMRT